MEPAFRAEIESLMELGKELGMSLDRSYEGIWVKLKVESERGNWFGIRNGNCDLLIEIGITLEQSWEPQLVNNLG